ncbi:MAG: type IX secretion system membrane protein PorP/SprF, partial [Bacteroidales bacterium]
VGLGGYIFNDQNGAISRTGMQLSYAYHIRMQQSQLSFGLSGMFYQFGVDQTKLRFEEQDDFFEFANKTIFIPDANAGIYYSDPRIFAGFSASGMKDGEEYWYAAFLYDGTTIVVGNECKYKSRGAQPASIVDMHPKKGNLSDTVNLRLSGIIGGVSGLTVRFDNHVATIVEFMNDVLSVIVPAGLNVKVSSVSITTGNTTNVFATKFELVMPEITDFFPAEAYPGETITINGQNFDPVPTKNVVRFNDVITTVVSSTTTQLKVIVPYLEGIDCQLSVTVGTLTGVAPGIIKVLVIPGPEITDFFPAEVYPGQLVTINGNYFGTGITGNIVKFNNTNALIISSSFNQIQVLAPNLEGHDCQISVIAGNKTGVANGLIKILFWPELWHRVSDHPEGNMHRMGSFVIGDYGYTGLGTRVHHDYSLKFWRYDYTDDSWLEVALFPGITRVSPMGFSIGGRGYIVSGSTLDDQSGQALRDLYEYNPGTNSWTRLGDYPGNLQNNYIGWAQVVNDKAYINFSPQDFYSYVPSTNQWTKLSNPSGQLFSHSSCFVMGDIIYLVGGIDNYITHKREVWAYNTSTNTWTRKNDFPGEARRSAVGLGIDGQYYIGLGINGITVFKDFWRYDVQNDIWERMQDFAGAARGGVFCMVLNQMAFIGTGYLSYNNLASDVYRFNPSAEK